MFSGFFHTKTDKTKINIEECFPTPKVKTFVLDEINRRTENLSEALHGEDKDRVEEAYRDAKEAFDVKLALKSPPPETKKVVPTYLIEYRLLKRAFKLLTTDSSERMVLVTGPELNDGMFVLSRMIEPETSRRSACGVEPEFGDMIDTLSEMEEKDGTRLIACFHSHPGNGKAATGPSGIDIGTQKRLERGGYPTIGAIFSRDGWVRFYSVDRKFEVEITGKGGEERDEKIFKLEEDKVKGKQV